MVRAYLIAAVALLVLGAVAVVMGLPLVLTLPVLFAVLAGFVLQSISRPDERPAAPDLPNQRRSVLSTALSEHPAVDRTGDHVAGAPVYETAVDDRPVTAQATHAADGRSVALRTPLEVTRRGVGFELRGGDNGLTVEREPSAVQTGGASHLLAGVETTLSDVRVGHLRVDDRLGLVEHRLDDLQTGEAFRRQAEALAEVGSAVERAATGDESPGATGAAGVSRPSPQVETERE